MHTDSHYQIGHSHLVCQDYAASQGDIIAVSDGCSSAVDTDIGARLLAREALRVFGATDPAERRYFSATLGYHTVRDAAALLPMTGCDPSCLHATLLVGWADKTRWHVVMYGDGLLVVTGRDGKVKRFVSVRYDNEAPPYLCYHLGEPGSGGQWARWRRECGGQVWVLDAGPEGLGAYRDEEATFHVFHGTVEDTQMVALGTDGLATFQSKGGDTLAIEEVVEELARVKSFAGDFMKRRLRRMCQDLGKRGYLHQDDVAVAAMVLGELA